MPENFESDYDFAIDKGLTYDEALLDFERFTNYWIANPSKNANKRDWQRTWYNCVTSPIGRLAKKLEKEKQAGGNNGNFSKNQKILVALERQSVTLSMKQDLVNPLQNIAIKWRNA
ncbi:hypothetical protein [Bartonella sp. CM100XJJH]|uniref:hypothetical protein n=1 Tax=Bartonella sp. CM100XJJH TaxID=3243543 RepID=UPI0035CF7AFC